MGIFSKDKRPPYDPSKGYRIVDTGEPREPEPRPSLWGTGGVRAQVPAPAPRKPVSADPRITKALEVPFAHAETDDPQVLKWILDQMIRHLHTSPEHYQVYVHMYNSRPAVRDWETGVEP